MRRSGPARFRGMLALLALSTALLPRPTHAQEEWTPPPVVIAVIEGGGFNVLHSDFGLSPGAELRLPAGMPPTTEVSLPQEGTFEQRLQAVRSSPLGNLSPGTLYRIAGTRIIGVYTVDGGNLTEDRRHATGTTSAAVGLEHGTNPNALLVYLPDTSRKAWEWLEKQDWIDMISTSYYTVFRSSDGHPTCNSAASIRRIVEAGRPVFSAIGNGEQAGHAFAPSGVPEAYQVGGVDKDGRTFLPQWEGTNGEVGSPTRPYETGDRFSFPAASPNALTGSSGFGGTSGATPSTAGRAAELITFARTVLRSTGGFTGGALATLGPKGLAPERGPLSDGSLTVNELADLLHHTAVPGEPPSPARYLVEGYGALSKLSVAAAKAVLDGSTEEPQRPEEDQMHELVDPARGHFFPAERCG